MMKLLLLLATTLSLLGSSAAQNPFTVEEPCVDSSGNIDQKFDVSSLQCVSCAAADNKKVDTTFTNGRQCVCSAGFLKSDALIEDAFTCSACPAGQASTRDSTKCLPCGATTAGLTAGECTCATPKVNALVEKDQEGNFLTAKACVACPNNTRVVNDPYQCEACPDENMVVDSTSGACSCPTSYTPLNNGRVCILTTRVNAIAAAGYVGVTDSVASAVTYSFVKASDTSSAAVVSLSSLTVTNNYRGNLLRCRDERDREACQAVGNMCVMNIYTQTAAPCADHLKLVTEIGGTPSNGFAQWISAMPWLYYQDTTVLSGASSPLLSKYSLKSTSDLTRTTVSHMKFVLAKYAFNGTYLGMEDLAGQLQMCGGDAVATTRFLRFATSYENQCSLSLSTLLTAAEPTFYDMYIVDKDNKLYPVPVKITNLAANADGAVGALNRRFFLYDNIGGRTTGSPTTPEVLVYAKSITLRVEMFSGSSQRIFPPQLIIEYAARRSAQITAATSGATTVSTVSFKMEYVKGDLGLWLGGIISGVIFSVIWFLLKLYVDQRTHKHSTLDLMYLARLAVFGMGAAADLFFWLVFIWASWMFIIYKGQEVPEVLIPEDGSAENQQLSTVVNVCFWFKLCEVSFLILRQCHIDIFFLDWEKPRATGEEKPETADAMEDKEQDDADLKAHESVSVWRKLFVANEWNDLQVARLLNIPLSLFMLLFFLRGLGLEYWATAQPSMTDLSRDAAPISPILRFAVVTFFWLVVAGSQLIIRQLLYHRYVKDEAAQFVDLLATSNISAFIVDGRFHLYYLHGKTVHSHADVSLTEMLQQIAAEESNLTKERGLLPGRDTFEVYISTHFRARYDKIYSRVREQEEQRRMQERRQASLNGRGGRGPDEERGLMANGGMKIASRRMVEATHSLNQFLISFIDKNDPHFPWEESIKTFWERRFNLPPIIEVGSPVSYFYDDPQFGFTSTVLMGIEYDLLVLTILFHAVMDLWANNNTFVSVLTTYAFNWALVWARGHWGQINLSRKILVDDRFLI